ncbi:MAG TPA: ribosome-associated translation inhibitor RaiA [Candidatus Acidoferrales bacterium]|nr:ribosome-associated translation inhibitor RaiA [Candidatus Acidoferrales bacterium]
MKIYIKGRNLKVTPALRGYAEEKIGHVAHYLDQIIDAHVTLRMERELQIVDVVLNLKHFLIKAEERSPDMYASIDLVRDRLEQQIRKYKTKHWSHHVRVNGKAGPGPKRKAASTKPANEGDDADEAEKSLRIVRSKKIDIKKMDPQDAAHQMELLGHDFFLFVNDQTGAVNVLYKRRGGQLGLIETVS